MHRHNKVLLLLTAIVFAAWVQFFPPCSVPAFANTSLDGDLDASVILAVPMNSPPKPQEVMGFYPPRIVEYGDTLSDFAFQYDLSQVCLQEANRIKDPNTIEVGQALVIPMWEVRTYWATGGESLVDFAAFCVILYGKEVPLTDLLAANSFSTKALKETLAVDADVYQPGLGTGIIFLPDQPIYVPLNGIGLQLGENATRTEKGLRWTRKLLWPLVGPLSQSYGGPNSKHAAIDIPALYRAAIICPRDGVVLDIGNDDQGTDQGAGTYIFVAHRWDEDGTPNLVTSYYHVSRLGDGVGIGLEVKAGQVLAYVGNNGHSTGPHLDFRVRLDGELQNPLDFLVGGD